METIELIQNTLDYIDAHITEKLMAEELAALAGYSTYHYYRLFHQYVGMPVMEYITKRKLTYSCLPLRNGERVMDVALTYQFETHAGYTKAFKKFFGYSPNYYRMHAPLEYPIKINLENLNQLNIGGILMEPKIIKRDTIKIVGYKFDTTLKNNAHTRDIPAFWDNCDTEGKEAKLYATQQPIKHGEYGICINLDSNTEAFSYVLGIEVESFEHCFEEMSILEILPATYAIFTTPAVLEQDFVTSIQGTWHYILQDWFPHSCYEVDDTKPDFEFYDERCHSWNQEKLQMEIYIPIKGKE